MRTRRSSLALTTMLAFCAAFSAALHVAASDSAAQTISPESPNETAPPSPLGVAQPPEGARLIEIDEFRRLFLGKTLSFVLGDGRLWGTEYYDLDGYNVTFLHRDGVCLAGHWDKRDDYYCFYYREKPSCWLTYEIDGQIEVLSRDGQLQRVAAIEDDRPISCEPELIGRDGLPAPATFEASLTAAVERH